MWIETSQVLVDEHINRLRDAAQSPSSPLARRVWAIVRRRAEPPSARIAARSDAPATDRLAA